jgi:hypothetical protein
VHYAADSADTSHKRSSARTRKDDASPFLSQTGDNAVMRVDG